jgi:hypothetical protein
MNVAQGVSIGPCGGGVVPHYQPQNSLSMSQSPMMLYTPLLQLLTYAHNSIRLYHAAGIQISRILIFDLAQVNNNTYPSPASTKPLLSLLSQQYQQYQEQQQQQPQPQPQISAQSTNTRAASAELISPNIKPLSDKKQPFILQEHSFTQCIKSFNDITAALFLEFLLFSPHLLFTFGLSHSPSSSLSSPLISQSPIPTTNNNPQPELRTSQSEKTEFGAISQQTHPTHNSTHNSTQNPSIFSSLSQIASTWSSILPTLNTPSFEFVKQRVSSIEVMYTEINEIITPNIILSSQIDRWVQIKQKSEQLRQLSSFSNEISNNSSHSISKNTSITKLQNSALFDVVTNIPSNYEQTRQMIINLFCQDFSQSSQELTTQTLLYSFLNQSNFIIGLSRPSFGHYFRCNHHNTQEITQLRRFGHLEPMFLTLTNQIGPFIFLQNSSTQIQSAEPSYNPIINNIPTSNSFSNVLTPNDYLYLIWTAKNFPNQKILPIRILINTIIILIMIKIILIMILLMNTLKVILPPLKKSEL